MIKIHEQDTIIDIVNKINACSDEEIILDFPFWHPVIHNYLSLKIIKSKASPRSIIICTADILSRKIWKPLWIRYIIHKETPYVEDPNTRENILKHNFTFFEYLSFRLRKKLKWFFFIFTKTPLSNIKYYAPYDTIKKSGIWLMLIGLLTSIWMLLFVFYFAVSKTYIYITPEINVLTKARNFIYAEIPEDTIVENNLTIPIKKITATMNLDETYQSTQIDYNSTKRAKWKVTIINEMRKSQTLKPDTRFVSQDGILFKLQEWVTVPAMTRDGSWYLTLGTAEWTIQASIFDEDWKFIGSRWNVWKSTFVIPWLKYNQDKVYAKTKWQFTGGSDQYSYIIWNEDIKNAEGIIKEKLKKAAFDKLNSMIKEENFSNNMNYEILWVRNIIKYNDLEIKIPQNIKAGSKVRKFNLKGHISISAYIYNKDLILNNMKNMVTDMLLEGTEKFMYIDEKSLRFASIISREENPLKIKATNEIQVGIAFDFDNNSNYYVQKVKSSILWVNKGEAKNLLLNDQKISNVVIKTSPFFLTHVSNIPENIILKIKE